MCCIEDSPPEGTVKIFMENDFIGKKNVGFRKKEILSFNNAFEFLVSFQYLALIKGNILNVNHTFCTNDANSHVYFLNKPSHPHHIF